MPFCFVVGPYGMVFGVLAAEPELDVLPAVAFSLAVIGARRTLYGITADAAVKCQL